MAENKQNKKEIEQKVVIEENEKQEEKTKKTSKIKARTLLVLSVIAIFLIGSLIAYRTSYLETLEIGEQYISVFEENVKYKIYIGIINFIVIFMIMYITNRGIKKGLKSFFEDEKKEMPKLPNKSLALIMALITSVIVSNMFLQKTIWFVNSAEFGIPDPIYNTDIGFYLFQAPLIGQLLYYGATMLIILTIYIATYYIITFNKFFEGVDSQTLKNSKFIKQLLSNVMLITIFIAGIILFNIQNMGTDTFLTLNDKQETSIVGAGAVDGIKMWGYRAFAVIIVLAVYIAIKAFKKQNTKRVLKSLSVVPVYLVCLFIVIVSYNLIFINGSKLEKQKAYITENIDKTKIAYDINIDEVSKNSTGTITDNDANENQEIINNIPVVTSKVAINDLQQKQTSTGYYTYSKVMAGIYNKNLAYISARELANAYNTEEYTHGFGVIISDVSETDEAGNVKYLSKDFENEKIEEPRIYYGTKVSGTKISSRKNKEFDYPKTTTDNVTYNYQGDGGISLNIIDKICVAISKGDLKVAFANGEDKILLNRNIIERAKKIMPYLMYDEEPYLIISDAGELYWVIDAYTTSNDFPYAQKTKIAHENETKEINYIRNSVKVIINAYDGETDFYITDKTDPIAMVYNNMYKTLFKEGNEIPEGISKHFTYSQLLYSIQAEMLTKYHSISADVLYRGNDVWEIASYSSLITKTAATKMEPYYTMVKNEDKTEIGLVIAYNQYGKESLNAYLVGTVENGKNKLVVYKFTGDSTVLGPMQLDSLIEQDETISKELSGLTATGTKITKEMVIVPVNDTLIYVVPIYQTSLNETNSVPILKKVVVASGNKIAIGDDLGKAVKNLLSPNGAVSVEVEDTSTTNGLIETIIKANNNLSESNKSNDWEQIGRDIEALQKLIKQLETLVEAEKENTNNTIADQNLVN